MPNTIENTASDIYVSMSNSAFARPVSLQAGWNKIRLGIRCRLTDLGSGPTGTPKFAFGLCSGTTNILGDATTTHFVGTITTPASWNYYTGTGSAVYYTISIAPFKRIGTTESTGNPIFSDFRFPIYMTGTNIRYYHFVEIVKGSPSYTFNCFNPHGNNPAIDYSDTQFRALMGATTLSLPSYSYGSDQVLAVDEATNGTLNAVNCWWNRSDFKFEIHDIAVAIIG